MPAGPTMNEQAYERLRSAVVLLELEPGERVSSLDLADRLELPVAGVRYAIQRLDTEGVLLVAPRAPTVVAPLSISEVRQAYMARTALEALAARLASRRGTEAQLTGMRAELDQVSAASLSSGRVTRDAAVQMSLHLHGFHRGLAAAAHNQVLDKLLRQATTLTERFEHYRVVALGLAPPPLDDYVALLDAIARRDPDAAETIVHTRLGGERWRTSTAELDDMTVTAS